MRGTSVKVIMMIAIQDRVVGISIIDHFIQEANIDKGIIVLLTGNGKGKSSSALGMVCRALGYELQVAIVKFLKGTQAVVGISIIDHFATYAGKSCHPV
jgi:ATP:corrinoid adenosyltransferase